MTDMTDKTIQTDYMDRESQRSTEVRQVLEIRLDIAAEDQNLLRVYGNLLRVFITGIYYVTDNVRGSKPQGIDVIAPLLEILRVR